ncbi:hypothetical protein [Nocardia sp. NPDC003345]
MQKTLARGIVALAIAAGSVAGTATATAGPGLPLEPAAPTARPQSVAGPSTGSALGDEGSGSALTGPVSSGSAEAAGSLFMLLGALFGVPSQCPPICH